MKQIYALLIALFLGINVNAQGYVNIPDTAFVHWLQLNLPAAMNGNYMDTTSPDVTTLSIMDISERNISDLTGIQYFISLTQLYCSNNHLPNIPYLAPTLKTLECYRNHIISLPTLPDSLKSLVCKYNQLTVLPAMPSTLEKLDFSHNTVDSFPALPPTLRYLDYSSTAIHIVPVLTDSLQYLYCDEDSITLMPPLPDSLIGFSCNANHISNLLALPVKLQSLNCGNNPLNNLPALPVDLQYLYCASNQLSTLPALPDSLRTLICAGNYLTNLPSLPNTIVNLNCEGNQITVIGALPASLIWLHCEFNQLTTLPAFPASLGYLNCQNNQLTSLPNLPVYLHTLYCDNNQLTGLPDLPELSIFTSSNNHITCFPTFPNISINTFAIEGNPFTCLPNYIPAMNDTLLMYPLCLTSDTINNPNGCTGFEGVLGYIFNDNNGNCQKDSADGRIKNIHMVLLDTANNFLGQTYSLSNGIYDIPQPNGFYIIRMDTTGVPLLHQCPHPGIDSVLHLDVVQPVAFDVNFALGCKTGYDLGVRSVVRNGYPFPGELHTLRIKAGDLSQWYQMNCADSVSGQVQITITGPAIYQGTGPGALTPYITGNVFTYAINDFGSIDNETAFALNFLTDTTAIVGDQICAHVTIYPLTSDFNTVNNIYDYCYDVMFSHDPNLKEVYPVNVTPYYDGYFIYTIHFQNTGTFMAMNIRIVDTLSQHLDLATFQVIDYSHANTVALNNNILTIRFQNIHLPDSTSDPVGSNGFVQYRIKAKPSVNEGSHIENTAWIYFDFNPPIATNTTINLFNVIGVNEINEPEQTVVIYPNPATTKLIIEGLTQKAIAEVYDISGKLLLAQQLISYQLDVSSLATGLYFIRLITSEGRLVKKFVKE
jgi:hypothetical protein